MSEFESPPLAVLAQAGRRPPAARLGVASRRRIVRLRQLGRLAGPITVQMLSFTAMGLVDTLYVGWLGTSALAAVAFCAVASHFLHAFGTGLLGGVRIAVSQSHGARDAQAGDAAASQGLVLSVLMGVLVACLALVAEPLLHALGAAAGTTELGARWLSVRLLAAPFWFGTLALGGWFQGRGDTRTPMRATLLANGLNIALDPVFIFGWGPLPALGVQGAALATFVGFAGGFVHLAAHARRGLGPSALVDRAAVARIWRLGSPAGVRALFEVGAWMAFCAMLARVGETAMAAHLVVIRVVSVSFLPGHAVGEAAGVLVGQAVGGGRERHAVEAWTAGMVLGVVVMGGFSVVFHLVPGLALAPFGLEPAVLSVALLLLQVAVVFQVFDAVAMVGLAALNGAGDTRFVMAVCMATGWLLKLPLGWLLAVEWGAGAPGAWWALTAEIVVLGAVVLLRLRGRSWLRQGV
jgi:MATE family multidrug resistance protein